MIVDDAFRPFSPSEAVSILRESGLKPSFYAIDHTSHTFLPDLALVPTPVRATAIVSVVLHRIQGR
jgi:hypothetical protein